MPLDEHSEGTADRLRDFGGEKLHGNRKLLPAFAGHGNQEQQGTKGRQKSGQQIPSKQTDQAAHQHAHRAQVPQRVDLMTISKRPHGPTECDQERSSPPVPAVYARKFGSPRVEDPCENQRREQDMARFLIVQPGVGHVEPGIPRCKDATAQQGENSSPASPAQPPRFRESVVGSDVKVAGMKNGVRSRHTKTVERRFSPTVRSLSPLPRSTAGEGIGFVTPISYG